MYVNGKWYDTARIADDQVGVGSYSFLNIPQRQLLENILKEVSTQTNLGIVYFKSQVNDSF
jgi:putative endopeptidase